MQLRGEMLLREENYNKHFRNGGVGARVLDVSAASGAEQGLVNWMLKAGVGGVGGIGGGGGGGGGGGLGIGISGARPAGKIRTTAATPSSTVSSSRRDTRRSTADGRDASMSRR